MTRKILFVVMILLCSCYYGGLLHAQISDEGSHGSTFFINYIDGEESDLFKSRRLAERFETLAALAVPGAKSALKCRIIYAKEGENIAFGASKLGKEIRIRLPHTFNAWSRDKESLHMLMSWFVLARLGLSPENGRNICDHWLIVGLTRKATGESMREGIQLSRYFPASTALTASGITPSLRTLLSSSPNLFDNPSIREFSAEYSEILVESLLRGGFMKNAVAGVYIGAALNRPDISQYRLFIENAGPDIAKKSRKIFIETPTWEDMTGICDEWFTDALNKRLIGYFMPYASAHYEVIFRQVTRITYSDASGREHVCELKDIPLRRESIPELNNHLNNLLGRISELSANGAPEFQKPLTDIRSVLIKCRTEGGEIIRDELVGAEERFYKVLSQRHALELYLSQAELRFVSPKSLYFRGLMTLDLLGEQERSALPAINRYLDEKDAFK